MNVLAKIDCFESKGICEKYFDGSVNNISFREEGRGEQKEEINAIVTDQVDFCEAIQKSDTLCHIPVVFIHVGTNNPFRFSNLCSVVSLKNITDLSVMGIPDELNLRLPFLRKFESCPKSSVDFSTNPPHIIFLYEKEAYDLEYFQRAVIAFAAVCDFPIHLVGDFPGYFEEMFSPGIGVVLHLESLSQEVREHAIYICEGYRVVDCVCNKRPVICLGSQGLGGWLHPDNFETLWDADFQGRPLGNTQDVIVGELLEDEVFRIINEENLHNVLDQNSVLYSRFVQPEASFKKFDSIIEESLILGEFLRYGANLDRLYPIYNRSLERIGGGEDQVILSVKKNCYFLGVLEADVAEFVENLDGDMNLLQLFEEMEIEESEGIPFFLQLWQKKIINFNFN
ncbi:MAG: hypothetical protein ACEPOZ_20435 [Marinifilaceae bacterium]